MTVSAWIDVGGLTRPLRDAIEEAVEFPGGDNRAPADTDPPYFVVHTTSTVRDEAGGVRWGVLIRSVGGTAAGPLAQQARLLGDRISRWLCDQDFAGRYVNPIDLPGVRVLSRESNGDGHEEPGDVTDEWAEGFTLTLQPAGG